MLESLAGLSLILVPICQGLPAAGSLTLDNASAMAQAPKGTASIAQEQGVPLVVATPGVLEFGKRAPGTSINGPLREPDWISVTLGVAGDSDPGTHYQLAVMPSWFLAERFEFGVELSAWYFDQSSTEVGAEGGSEGGGSFRFIGRWHVFGGSYSDNAPEKLDWTIFAEGGIGMLFSSGAVPPGGTDVNVLPTVGAGATFRLDDSGTRLIIGARWQHVSNARINGDSDNPAFDAPMGYVGVQWAW